MRMKFYARKYRNKEKQLLESTKNKKKNKNNVFLIEKNCAQVYNESKSNAVKTRLL